METSFTPLVFEKNYDMHERRYTHIHQKLKSELCQKRDTAGDTEPFPSVSTMVAFVPSEGNVLSGEPLDTYLVTRKQVGEYGTALGKYWIGNICEIRFEYDVWMNDEQLIDHICDKVREIINRTVEMYKGVQISIVSPSYHNSGVFGCMIYMSTTDNEMKLPIAQSSFLMYNPKNTPNSLYDEQYSELMKEMTTWFRGYEEWYYAEQIKA